MMEKSHIIHLNLSLIIAFTSLIFVANVSATLAKTPHTKVVLPLIHRDSVLSPFYNNPTLHVISSTDDSSLAPDHIRSPLMPAGSSGFAFFINVSIGEPPVPQLLIMDTGSSLTWVCTSCVGSPLSGPVYDPTESSTYEELPCDLTWDPDLSASQCGRYGYFSHCDQGSHCSFDIKYGDGSHTKGILAREKFIFETSTDGLMEVSDIVFGSAVDLSGNAAANKIPGILGLGPTYAINLLDRFSNQFSYCIGNISDKSYLFNQLILGDGAILEGSSTDLITDGDYYLVRLEGISVGEKQLDITFGELDHNLLVDSGTTYTRLRRSVFDPLKKEVEDLMSSLVPPAGSAGERLCYKGNLERDLKGFPTVTFHFSGETDLDLDVEAMFRRENDDVFCMAVDVEGDHHGILGVYAQQYYNIGFDLEENQISFQRIDCELLEE